MFLAEECAKMVSDEEIVRHLTAVLREADLSTTTTTAIRHQLQEELGVDLTDKKVFIRQQVDLYLQTQAQEQQQQEEDGEDVVGEDDGETQDDDDEDGDEEDEEEQASKSSKNSDSKRTRAKIDRAIKARYVI